MSSAKIIRSPSRREALGLLGMLGVGAGAAACGASAAVADGGIGIGDAASNLDCILTPEATEGPFFVDEKLNRGDLIAGETDPAITNGLPLGIGFSIFAVSGNACTPVSNAFVDIWQADVNGTYSDEASSIFQPTGTAGKKFLRGYQVSNSAGVVQFKTIYPGWYTTRTAHIHFKIRLYSAAGDKTLEMTSQLYFDDATSDAVFGMAPYVSRGPRSIPKNTNDQVFNGTGPGSMIDTVGLPAGQIPPGNATLVALANAPGGGRTTTLKVGIKLPA